MDFWAERICLGILDDKEGVRGLEVEVERGLKSVFFLYERGLGWYGGLAPQGNFLRGGGDGTSQMSSFSGKDYRVWWR